MFSLHQASRFTFVKHHDSNFVKTREAKVSSLLLRVDKSPNLSQLFHSILAMMMFSFNTFLSVLVLAVACDANKEATVELGAAEEYAILAKTGISTVPNSMI
jgi:ubiquinone biosynthesis protein COQ9